MSGAAARRIDDDELPATAAGAVPGGVPERASAHAPGDGGRSALALAAAPQPDGAMAHGGVADEQAPGDALGDAAVAGLCVARGERAEPLRECVRSAVRTYLDNLGGHEVTDLYRFVLAEVERPLLEAVLEHTRNNQSVAAQLLGMSRSTLRKKLGGGSRP